MPGLAGDFHGLVFRRQLGVTWHGEEAPGLLAGFGVIGRYIAAHAILRPTIADDDLAVDHPRRAGDGVAAFMVAAGVHRPDPLAGLGIDRLQAPVQYADVDLALPHRHASVYRIAAGLTGTVAIRLRVVFPEQLAVAGIQRVHHRKRPRGVHHPIYHNGRGLHPTVQVEFVAPGQA
ncbi:hypothetical protein D3C79_771510 [compost metagenome]